MTPPEVEAEDLAARAVAWEREQAAMEAAAKARAEALEYLEKEIGIAVEKGFPLAHIIDHLVEAAPAIPANAIREIAPERYAAAEAAKARAEAEAAAAEILPAAPTVYDLITQGALIDPRKTETRADLRPLALYLIDARRPIPKAINSVSRANRRIPEADRLTDDQVIALVHDAAADIETIRRREKAAEIREKEATKAAKIAKIEEASDKASGRFLYLHPRWGWTIDAAAVADYLHDTLSTVSFNRTLYVYQDGVYKENTGEIEREIKTITGQAENKEQLTRLNREVLAHLLATEPFSTYPFNRAPGLIPVANGVIRIDYDTETPDLLEHSPEYRFTYRLPVEYDKTADGAPTQEELKLLVDPDVVDVLNEIPALALLQMQGNKPYKRSYLLQAGKDAGKSTYLERLGLLLGEENICDVDLQKITSDRFANGSMEGKILNIHDDLKDIPLKDVGAFKSLTGRFKQRIERKHANAYEGMIKCVHVFSCNEPPETPPEVEYDDAWWGRWEFINFTNVFEIDPTYLDRTATPADMTGWLNDVIRTMIRIHKHGLYRDSDPGRVKESWKLASDLVAEFLEAEMEPMESGLTNFDKGRLFLSFRKWCTDNKKPEKKIPSSAKTFAPMIFRNRFIPRQVRNGKARDWVYAGPWKWKEGSDYEKPFS